MTEPQFNRIAFHTSGKSVQCENIAADNAVIGCIELEIHAAGIAVCMIVICGIHNNASFCYQYTIIIVQILEQSVNISIRRRDMILSAEMVKGGLGIELDCAIRI